MPSRQDLIAAALAEGRIDNVTSLVYRAEALFDLPELPAEFAGAPSLFEDTALFNQIVDALPTLSPADQARLRPFIARPTEPDSIFASGGLPAAGRSSPLMAMTGVELGVPLTAAVEECRTWTDSGTQSTRFRVWACAGADSSADQSAVSTVATTLDGLWTQMTKPVPGGMGEPLPDGRGANPGPEFGGDRRIDVYVLTMQQAVFRGGLPRAIPDGAIAAAIPSEQFEGNRSSGFMLVNRGRLDGDEVRNDLIHEFYHVLQFGHNRNAWLMGKTQHWFVEASATWAETFYGNSSLVHGWFNKFQLSPLGLEATDVDHTYAAYVWPIFMQQETGSAAAMFRTWQAIENVGAGDFTGMSSAIDAQLKFADRFRDFAVRNLNREILGKVTKPQAEKRYQQLDPSIPDNTYPVPIEGHTIDLGPPKRSATVTIPPLAARYFYFEGTDLARLVTLDLASLSPADSLDADVLAHVKDQWERRPVKGTKFTYCRDVAEDDIDQLYLVVSNHSREDSSTISGDVVTTATSCNGWHGTMTATESWGPVGGIYGTATSTFDGLWSIDPTAHETCLVGREELQVDCVTYRPTGTVTWTWDAHYQEFPDSPPCDSTTAGSADPASVAEPGWRELNFAPVDKDHLQVSGFGKFEAPPVKCGFGEINARFPPPYFELFEGASSANPPGQDGSTCYTTTWQIDVKATTITGSCVGFDYSSPAFFPHSLQYTWNLTHTGDAPGG